MFDRYSKGYQFWTQTDKDGSFSITNIVPGSYNLYAWVPGFIGNYKYEVNVDIKPGKIYKNSYAFIQRFKLLEQLIHGMALEYSSLL